MNGSIRHLIAAAFIKPSINNRIKVHKKFVRKSMKED
jgi:hypothetical protein